MAQSIPTWCWYCKKEIPFTVHSCPSCGRTLHDATKVVQCQKCGKFLLLNTPRCIQCGEPTPRPEGWEDPAAAAAAPPPVNLPPEEPPEGTVVFPPTMEPQPSMPPPGMAQAPAAPMPPPGSPEMMRMFEELEARNKRAAQEAHGAKKTKKGIKLSGKLIAIIAAVVVLAGGAGVYFGVIRPNAQKNPKPPKQEAPAYCAEDKHVWAEATCTQPKTCTVCGKTEGAALGHQYVENICTRCGQAERLFYFSELGSKRTKDTVIFFGKVENFTGGQVDSLKIGLQLFDENKKLVSTLSGVEVSDAAMAPRGTAAWQITFDDTSIQWKYWRVFAEDYSPKPQ